MDESGGVRTFLGQDEIPPSSFSAVLSRGVWSAGRGTPMVDPVREKGERGQNDGLMNCTNQTQATNNLQ